MGTTSMIVFEETDTINGVKKRFPLLSVYTQSSGMVEQMGSCLAAFLKARVLRDDTNFEKLYNIKMKANGFSDAVLLFVSDQKTKPYGMYACRHGRSVSSEEFVYIVSCNEFEIIQIRVYKWGKKIFDGSDAEYVDRFIGNFISIF